ncbi:MAG: hypothetical protein JXR76_12255 [Deltaproteobacteria bacterium]|nr:hypothetical protein [Deltaproteobacteria bacterium]
MAEEGANVIDWQRIHAPESSEAASAQPEELPKKEIAQKTKVDGWFDGKLVGLGQKITVTVYRRKANGVVAETHSETANSENDLTVVLGILVNAFAEGSDGQSKKNSKYQQSNTLRIYQGGFLGGGGIFGPGDIAYAYGQAGYDCQFEIRNLRPGAYIGVNLPGEPERFNLFGGFTMGAFLNDKKIAPYIGGGVGIFIGLRMGDIDETDENHYDDDSTNASASEAFGFEGFAFFGIEFLREKTMRMHLEVQYRGLLDLDSNLGHGPGLNFGMSFY